MGEKTTRKKTLETVFQQQKKKNKKRQRRTACCFLGTKGAVKHPKNKELRERHKKERLQCAQQLLAASTLPMNGDHGRRRTKTKVFGGGEEENCRQLNVSRLFVCGLTVVEESSSRCPPSVSAACHQQLVACPFPCHLSRQVWDCRISRGSSSCFVVLVVRNDKTVQIL